ncbi:hypothetical protein LWI28_019307 [Acer negundo]|uniref:BURP domain-containing protein n=1 Tax=Acer negundo TaxID=4023 RepID=A0AAD5NV24_ACENE|nr:hypothetical protein LWI28_019307 [Acer negundo]KAK4836069.1 hypothetical protein QYF36_018130 [Acer negundo]
MASGFSSSWIIFIIFFFSFLVFLCAADQDHITSTSRKLLQHHHHNNDHEDNNMDPSQKIFFTIDNLKKGKSMEIYLSPKIPSSSLKLKSTTRLLSREEADSIPFTSSKLSSILRLFSISKDSPQAQAMNDTLKLCELEPIHGETKLCATSFESMLDFTRGILGLDTKLRVLTTSFVENPSTKPYLRNYTVVEDPREILAPKMVACHSMPYPYAVFYCHSQEGENRVFEISLEGGGGGERVEAVGVCHADTSHWDRDHVSFRVLNIEPGTLPVCHVFPPDNFVWVPAYFEIN